MKKRFLSFLMMVALWISLVPTALAGGDEVYTYEQKVPGGTIQYDTERYNKRGTAVWTVSGYTGNITEAPMLDKIECEFPDIGRLSGSVTMIGGHAFENCTSLTSVIMPSSIIGIRWDAFQGCTNLTQITIPDRVTVIGDRAFSGCTSLTNVTIPDSVTSIGSAAFRSCTSLTSVTIPSSVAYINEFLFFDCINLTSMTIPSGVTTIRRRTFGNCSSLTSVSIPSSVTLIEDGAFASLYRKTSLTDIYYGGSETQWKAIEIEDNLYGVTIHYNSAVPSNTTASLPEGTEEAATTNITNPDYIYDTADPGEGVVLPADRLETVTDAASAAEAVKKLTDSMTTEQKSSMTGVDLATLYAETAVSKAAKREVSGSEIIINAAAVADLQTVAAQSAAAVESALVSGGVSTARYLANTVTLSTQETGEISIRIDPDILTTEVDKIRVETPAYAITLKVEDLKADLTEILTITTQNVGTGFAPGSTNQKATVSIQLPKGRTTNPVTISLPPDSGDKTYQAVVNTSGAPTASKYNPATTAVDGKVNTSGTYTVMENSKDFTDITNKSAEMQKAIRYLASKGIISGTSATTFSPDDSISRAEIATLIIQALGKLDNNAQANFTDVRTSDWYYRMAASSQKAGLISGFEDNTFRGNDTILKEQIVTVAGRVLVTEMGYKEPSNTSSYLSKYKDTVAQWAQSMVSLATRENLVVYRTDGTFAGEKSMTRGDAAIIVYRMFQRIW